jgi:hypothetical protein
MKLPNKRQLDSNESSQGISRLQKAAEKQVRVVGRGFILGIKRIESGL